MEDNWGHSLTIFVVSLLSTRSEMKRGWFNPSGDISFFHGVSTSTRSWSQRQLARFLLFSVVYTYIVPFFSGLDCFTFSLASAIQQQRTAALISISWCQRLLRARSYHTVLCSSISVACTCGRHGRVYKLGLWRIWRCCSMPNIKTLNIWWGVSSL